MNTYGHNGVKRPKFAAIQPEEIRSAYLDSLFRMHPVRVVVVFDNPNPKKNRVERQFDRSSELLELFNKASLSAGSPIHVSRVNPESLHWEELTPDSLARLIAFFQRPGYSQPTSFRGLRYLLEQQPSGILLWKQAETVELLWKTIRAHWKKTNRG